jgi:putative membrane protein
MTLDTLGAVLAQAGPMGGPGVGPTGHGGLWGAMGHGWWGLLGPALLFVLLLLAAFVVFSVPAADRDDAVAELRRAYARGDLSEEEYERRRARLS